MFRKKKVPDSLKNNEEEEINEMDCFLCQEKLNVKSLEYTKHLEKQHGVIFGVKEIMKEGGKYQSFQPNGEPGQGEGELKFIRTDADTVKEMVEVKYLKKKRKSDSGVHDKDCSQESS